MGTSVGKERMRPSLRLDLEVTGAKYQSAIANDEQLVFGLMVVERWSKTMRSHKLDDAHRSRYGAAHLDRGEMVQEMKVVTFVGREHRGLWAGDCLFVTHAGDCAA